MYNHNKIEKKWQKFWEENQTYKFQDSLTNKKFYALDMFPYPSGKGLHVGHPKGYTATDVMSRYKKMQGYDVLHPIGWDAFGLPAEQYAIETNNDPAEFTLANIINFRRQLKMLGFCFDYNKEVNTTDPAYFKWTQWIFIQLFKNRLAEIKDIEVNWCPNLGTVLSNEEILIDKNGNQVSERGSHPVIKKPMRQWVLKISKYADKLLSGLDELDWPESLKALQRNWIGKTTGYNLELKLSNNKILSVFINDLLDLNNSDTILISTKSKLVDLFDLSKKELKFIQEANQKNERHIKANKEYNCLKLDSSAINPITNQHMNIYLADFVSIEFNLDSIILNSDSEFCQEFFNKNKIKSILRPTDFDSDTIKQILFENEISFIQTTSYKIRDWLFSRQRYWGEPFPVVFDENDKPYVLSENQLPLKLPKIDNYHPNSDSLTVLSTAVNWTKVKSNKTNKIYTRDTNTMPQWAGSCWYYLGYILKNQDQSYTDLNSTEAYERFKRWLPVDLYIGGQEHAVLHLLYARFWHRFLYDIGVVPTKEPFYKLINQGMILGTDNEKMSKSKGNIINPDDIIKDLGADTLRLYEMFMGPLVASMPWNNEKLVGNRKWLDRVYRLFNNQTELSINLVNDISLLDESLIKAYHEFIKQATNTLENQQFNLCISSMMVFINEVYHSKQFYKEYMVNFLAVLSLFCPHLAEELYAPYKLNYSDSVFKMKWPTYDESVLESDFIKYPVMIKNKLRDVLEIDKSWTETQIKEYVLNYPSIQKHLNDQEIKNIIIVKGKIINIII